MTWLLWSLLTLSLWGAWGTLTKVALTSLTWRQLFVLAGIVGFFYALWLASVSRPSLIMPLAHWLTAVLAVSAGLIGTVAFYRALEAGGRAAIVIPLTAAYPVVTVVLSVIFLREPLHLREVTAIILFLIALLLISR